jgi:hypothetical protein
MYPSSPTFPMGTRNNLRTPADVPLIAHLSNGDKEQSTHTCTLDLPDLPAGARAAHIIPVLASHSLLSVVTMCNAGCTVTFTKINCTIVYRGWTIVCGHKCTKTGLWMVPLKCADAQATAPPAVSNKHTHPTVEPTVAIAANVDAASSASEHGHYIHQCICSLPSATLLGALTCSEELITIRVSHRHLSRTIYLAPLPPTKDTCADIDQTLPPQETITTTLSLHVQRWITCSPNTKSAPCRMYFASPHWPTPSLAQCTPASLVHSLFAHSKVCSIFLLHMSMISMQSLFVPCPLAQMHPWRRHSQK